MTMEFIERWFGISSDNGSGQPNSSGSSPLQKSSLASAGAYPENTPSVASSFRR
jgi:hypothetical protein